MQANSITVPTGGTATYTSSGGTVLTTASIDTTGQPLFVSGVWTITATGTGTATLTVKFGTATIGTLSYTFGSPTGPLMIPISIYVASPTSGAQTIVVSISSDSTGHSGNVNIFAIGCKR